MKADCPYCDETFEGMTEQIVKKLRFTHIAQNHDYPIRWFDDCEDPYE